MAKIYIFSKFQDCSLQFLAKVSARHRIDAETTVPHFLVPNYSSRPQNVGNFVEVQSTLSPDTRFVYKHYGTLYFVIDFDNSENVLAMLDLIQDYVFSLDKCFRNVCELNILFNCNKVLLLLFLSIFLFHS
ncbi:unnamed protein product [Coffea canephora]|uniref:AP complex mu/sigma subunit domain-containing protein n=1 Tax=Coffea canephora TaxID=49390 RepID=A0A068V7S7_COFCA|nr:unnamed protein product [Coffea canephora]